MLVKDAYGQVFVAKELALNQMSKKDRRSAENEVPVSTLEMASGMQ